MAYELRTFDQATSTAGEDRRTVGAANLVKEASSICEDEFGKAWWHASVPDMRPVNTVTGRTGKAWA